MKGITILSAAVILSLTTVQAQSTSNDNDLLVMNDQLTEKGELVNSGTDEIRLGAFNEIIESSGTVVGETKTASYYRHHSKLSSFYSGVAIELTTSYVPLQRDYHLFDQFGNVKIHKVEDVYHYIITGYSSKKGAQKHLEDMIQAHASEARVVVFKKGEMKS